MNVVIIGYGKMGRILEQAVNATASLNLLAVVGKNANDNVYEQLQAIETKIDCIIDFSHFSNIKNILSYSAKTCTPVVICTTGFDNEQILLIKKTANIIPIVYSANMSIGVAILTKVIKDINSALGGAFDIEIIEKHHSSKEDAPSGTAKMLLEAIVEDNYQYDLIHGRKGLKKRGQNEIGVHAVRGGTIVGEHTVLFAGNDEMIEVKHTALSKRIFAEGAIKAVLFLATAKAGLYDINDVLFKNEKGAKLQ